MHHHRWRWEIVPTHSGDILSTDLRVCVHRPYHRLSPPPYSIYISSCEGEREETFGLVSIFDSVQGLSVGRESEARQRGGCDPSGKESGAKTTVCLPPHPVDEC